MSNDKKTAPTAEQMRANVEIGINRVLALSMLAQASGTPGISSYCGERQYNDIFGWPESITYSDYKAMYRRGGLGKTIINLPPIYTWRGDITVTVPIEDGAEKTADAKKFEKEFKEIWDDFNLKNVFLRADKLAGIGNYSAIRLGFTNDTDASQPLRGTNHRLAYAAVFNQENAEPLEWDTDPQSKNYGSIKKYNLQRQSNSDQNTLTGGTSFPSGEEFPVDSSRVVHIAEELEEDRVYGTPRLQACWNALIDRLKLLGGSAEMYFRGAFPGFNFNLDPEADISTENLQKMEEQIQNMILGLGRYVQAEGLSVDSVAPQVVDPTAQIAVQNDEVAATSRIPKRLLFGSEAGVLASGQESSNWDDIIENRRDNDCERWIRDAINLMMDAGALTRVEKFTVNWPQLEVEDGVENATISEKITNSIVNFFNNDGERYIPAEVFFEKILNWDKQDAEDIAAQLEEARGEGEDNEAMTPERANELADIIRRSLDQADTGQTVDANQDPESQTAE